MGIYLNASHSLGMEGLIILFCVHFKISEIDYPNSKDLDKYLNKSGIKLEYNSTFRSEISFNRSVIHVPTDVFDGGMFHFASPIGFQFHFSCMQTLRFPTKLSNKIF